MKERIALPLYVVTIQDSVLMCHPCLACYARWVAWLRSDLKVKPTMQIFKHTSRSRP